jgi:hypothetical protein
MVLATTQLHAISQEHGKENLQWHSQGSVMYVVIQNRQEMDFRMDREVYEFKVCSTFVLLIVQSNIYICQFQNPETVKDSGIIFFKMVNTHTLDWATGTNFNPYYDDTNHIAIRFDLVDSDDKEAYESLVQWIGWLTPTDDISLTLENAANLWNSLSELVSTLYPSLLLIEKSSEELPIRLKFLMKKKRQQRTQNGED